MTTAPRVFVVDDDASVRKSLTRLLVSAGYRVEPFASASEFLARKQCTDPCCLVLDVRMPGLSGLGLQKTLTAAGNRMSVVFVTGHIDVPMSVTAMKDGAVDVLTKPVDGEVLLDAIARAVAKSGKDLHAAARIAQIQDRVKMLTPRETEVFALVVTGMLNKQIGFQLGIGEKTVKVHRAQVMKKMEAQSVADLVRMADQLGLVSPRS
jgi:FixJ family two-component response regulator